MKTDAERIAQLEKDLEQVRRRLDQFFRSQCMAPLIDDQLAAINARQDALSQGRAA